jgi:hypothetical protein
MAGSVEVERLTTVIDYKAEPKVLVESAKAVDALDAKQKAATISADKLTAKMDGLADQMQETSDKSLALREQQLRLQRQIDLTGKPTAEQRKEMYRLKVELQDNELHAKKLAASQKVLQRELKDTKEETKRLAEEQRKQARVEQDAARARQQSERVQAKADRERGRSEQQAARLKLQTEKKATQERAREQAKIDSQQRRHSAIEARVQSPDELRRQAKAGGVRGQVAQEEMHKRSVMDRFKAQQADSSKLDIQGLAKQKLGFGGGMTAGAAAASAAVVGVAALAAGMVALGERVFDVSKRFQSLRASLITVTGSAANADKQFAVIKDFAATTPFQVDQATTAFVKLKALGLDSSTKSLTSWGNTASAMGKELNDMIEAVADATTGEFERLKEFGIKTKTVGDNVQFTFRGVTTTVKKEASAIQDYLLKIGETQFAGAMDRQMDTIGGALSNLGDQWDGFLLKIGEGGQMDGLKRVVQDVAKLMTDDLAVALGELQSEGTGILEDLVGRIDPKDLEGVVKILKLIVVNIRFMMKPVGFMLELAMSFLGAIGRVLGLLFDTGKALLNDVGKLVSDSFLGGLADKVSDAASAVGDFASGALTDLKDTVLETLPYTEELSYGWDAVSNALMGVDASAKAAQGSLLALLSDAFTKKIQDLSNKLELTGKKAVQGATDMQLQQMRAAGGEGGKIADAEIIRRKTAEHDARDEELFQAGGGDKFKTDSQQTATQGIEDAASDRADNVFRAARDSGASASEAKRMATMAKGEEIERLSAVYDATGKFPAKRKKDKKGKAAKDHGIEKIVKSRAEELGEQAGEREASRLVIRVNEGKESMSIEDALAAGETKRKDVRDKVLRDFYASGKLPPGVRSDLQRLTEIPSVEQQIGKVAPPVIAVTNVKVDASVGVLNVGQGASFSGTVRENAQELAKMINTELSNQLRVAIVDITQGELP